ncbi:hypothetical protein HGRIS_012934 [Hohenbuehelia grisea]|uniref:Elongin-A n=1 Tax=Hohenbuehelia grisea TaxID=104357 RepID=A0ABR3ITX3_9AGAR
MQSECSSMSSRRIPTLVQLCQRVAVNHIENITDVGGLSYEIARPILVSCNADALSQIEDSSPDLMSSTSELWEVICRREFALATAQLEKGEDSSLLNLSWKERYFAIREREHDRLEALTSKMKRRRQEEEDKKKEREVKITTRLPPGRKPFWGQNYQPKSLLQKTISDAQKIQKSMYNRALPPMVAGKTHRVLPPASSSALLPVPSSESTSRVTVNTVRRVSTTASNSPLVRRPSVLPASHQRPTAVPSKVPPPRNPAPAPPSSNASDMPSQKSPSKRNPTNSLFMPKHRAYSQLSQRSK